MDEPQEAAIKQAHDMILCPFDCFECGWKKIVRLCLLLVHILWCIYIYTLNKRMNFANIGQKVESEMKSMTNSLGSLVEHNIQHHIHFETILGKHNPNRK